MGPQVVAIVLPAMALFAHLVQIGKELGVNQLAARRATKAFNVGVLRWTRWPNLMQLNPLTLTPGL